MIMISWFLKKFQIQTRLYQPLRLGLTLEKTPRSSKSFNSGSIRSKWYWTCSAMLLVWSGYREWGVNSEGRSVGSKRKCNFGIRRTKETSFRCSIVSEVFQCIMVLSDRYKQEMIISQSPASTSEQQWQTWYHWLNRLLSKQSCILCILGCAKDKSIRKQTEWPVS